jgi:Domain of unknown function (DUF6285)
MGPAGDDPVTHDRPDAHELLEAVAAYLRDELLPAVPADQRFGVRVAANACAMIARETASLAPRRDREVALAQEIRDGAWDERLPELAQRLREEVRAKLAVAHPGWDAVADDGRW